MWIFLTLFQMLEVTNSDGTKIASIQRRSQTPLKHLRRNFLQN